MYDFYYTLVTLTTGYGTYPWSFTLRSSFASCKSVQPTCTYNVQSTADLNYNLLVVVCMYMSTYVQQTIPLTCLVLNSPVSSSRACISIAPLLTCPPFSGHFQWPAILAGSLSGPSFRVPCGMVTPSGIVGVASVVGRGSASAKVWGNVPGCQASGREWRERRRRERMLLDMVGGGGDDQVNTSRKGLVTGKENHIHTVGARY